MKKVASDALGSTFYLARIRSLEIKAYMLQISLMVGIGFFLALMQGASFKPFYFPLEYFMYVVYIMLFAMFFEAFFFTMLEMKNQSTDTAKYFIAKKASKNGLKIMAIAIVLFLVLGNPVSESFMEEKSSDTATHSLEGGEIVLNMTSVDRFGLMYKSVSIEGGTYSGNYDCYLIYSSYYFENMNDPASRSRLRFMNESALQTLEVTPPDLNFEEYVLLIRAPENSTGTFVISFHNDVKGDFVISTGIFLVATAILHAWWFVYLQRYIKLYGSDLMSM